ncbi:hypothetical protein HQ585_12210 [candidate division KSB1 bacterium]|nr:hypothetical protein [candidate division KSB1 bacterium]
MNIHPVQSQKGFLSAFVIIFVVTLGLLATGSAMLVRSESTNIGNQVAMIKAENAARGALHFARKFIAINGDSLTMPVLNLGDAEASMYYSQSGTQIDLYMTVTSGPVDNSMHVEMRIAGSLSYAIYASGSVSNQDTDDSTGTQDNSLIYQNAPSFPSVDVSGLTAVANIQGANRVNADATFTPGDGWPDATRLNFYNASGLPEVTIVTGNLLVEENKTIFGIYVVSGTVELEAGGFGDDGGRVDGIIYDAQNMLCTLGEDS